MTSVSPKNVSLLLVACIPIVGFACSSKNGVEDDTANPSNPIYNVTTGGGSGVSGVGGGSPIDNATWPPSGFTNVTDVEVGAYALGPQVGNDIKTTGSATIENSGSQCSGIYGLIRDFQSSQVAGGHPDFEYVIQAETGITTTTIGADGKPVYGNHPTGTLSTHSQADFDQWYNDDSTINRTYVIGLKLVDDGTGQLTFQSETFFPLDNAGFGNTEGQRHNFHFTTEIHTSFTYNGGEHFHFTGDDDVFVYINGQLQIDLGGVHNAENKDVLIDSLGLTRGQVYPIVVFQAERHTTESHFKFQTTLAFADCGQVPIGVVIN
jgi:fibro-slime domain-containing protein